ncbi:MAG: hypothetical protein RBS78_07725 [Coriobacteriia bacterium]|jgi:hypothetical protein|nr:hypothetical protein [Coriobacteriia bacterium]
MGYMRHDGARFFGGAMDESRYAEDPTAAQEAPEVACLHSNDECASRAADLSAEMYAHAERLRRRESLEALLSRGRGLPAR